MSLPAHSGAWRLVPQEGRYYGFQVQAEGEFDGAYHPPVTAYQQLRAQPVEGEVEAQEP